MKRVIFSPREVVHLTEDPDALRALAEYHSVKETEADGSDWSEAADFHEARKLELRHAATMIEAAYDSGLSPDFGDAPVVESLVRAHDALKRLVYSVDAYLAAKRAGFGHEEALERNSTASELNRQIAIAQRICMSLPVFVPPGEPNEL